jgi:hypothetical protein
MFDDQAGWGAADLPSTGDVVKDAMRKEQTIKYVPSYDIPAISMLMRVRDIIAFQDDLKGMCTSTFLVRNGIDITPIMCSVAGAR